MQRRWMLMGWLAISLLTGFICTGTIAEAQSDVPHFQKSECLFRVTAETGITCGTLTVYENRAHPEAGTIALPVVFIPARNPSPDAAPLIFLSGGPGTTALSVVSGFRNSSYIETHDMILFEQRGVTFALPPLSCPELDNAVINNFTLALPVDTEAQLVGAAAATCHDRLVSEGNDLSTYNTRTIAQDLEEFRQVMGFKQIIPFGVSYGTRLALNYLRDYPASVHSMVLDGVLPADPSQYERHVAGFVRAFETLLEQCASDMECQMAYPNLEAQFYRLVERLNTAPVPIVVNHPLTGMQITTQVTGFDFASGIFDALYNPATIEYIPFLIDQLDRGNLAVIEPLIQEGVAAPLDGEWGMFYSIQCQDEYPFNDPALTEIDINRFDGLKGWRTLIYGADAYVCPNWGVPSDPQTYKPPISDTPVLLLTGGYDPITPPDFAHQAAQTLTNGYVITFPHQSHVLNGVSLCASQMIAAFLHDPLTAPESCAEAEPARDFITSLDISPTPAFYRFNRAVIEGSSLWQIGILAMGLAGISVLVMALVVAGIRRQPPGSLALLWVATITAGLVLAFIVWLAVILTGTSSSLLAFGLPPGALGSRWVLLIAGMSTLLFCIIYAVTWHRQRAGERMLYGFVSVALTSLIGWLWWLGFGVF